MNRRQRKKKLKKRQAHQEQFVGLTKTVKYHDGSEIDLPRGRSPRSSLRSKKGVHPSELIEHRDELELMQEQGLVPTSTYVDETELGTWPTEEEWAELTKTARKRKRSVKSFAEKAGFSLSVGGNLKIRTDWYRA